MVHAFDALPFRTVPGEWLAFIPQALGAKEASKEKYPLFSTVPIKSLQLKEKRAPKLDCIGHFPLFGKSNIDADIALRVILYVLFQVQYILMLS